MHCTWFCEYFLRLQTLTGDIYEFLQRRFSSQYVLLVLICIAYIPVVQHIEAYS